jgi:HEAT repeat protein
VRALGRLGDPRASAALVLALRDPSADVKQETLAALGRTRATDAVDAIAPFLSERAPRLRLAAIDALGRIGSPEAVRALVAALGSGEEAAAGLEPTPLRAALVSAGPAAVPALHALLAGSPPGPAAASAAWVLGALRATGEAPAIVAAMRRGVLPVPAALHALAGAGAAVELPVALEFVNDPSPALRTEALDATLALLDAGPPDGRAVEPLAAALRDAHPSAADRAKIVAALGKTRAPRVAPLLAGLARASDPAVRLAAMDALGEVGPADGAGAPLLEALASSDASVRLHAATALGECGGPAERDALLDKLKGGDGVDRAAVLEALGGVLSRAPTEGAVARLADALTLAAGGARDGVLEALGRATLDSAVRVLADVSHSGDADDRRAAATLAAAHPGNAAALALVRALADDADPGVRAQAAWSLGTMGDGSDAARLEALAKSTLPDVAGNAAAALARLGPRAPGPTAPAAAPGRPVLVYVVPATSDAPRPGAPYALLFSDGTVRRGTTDRRGAVFEPSAPPGTVTLR